MASSQVPWGDKVTPIGVYVQGTNSSGDVVTVSQLPANAPLADNGGNPNSTLIGACQLGWDGSNMERLRVANVTSDLNAAAVTTTGNSIWTNTSGKKRRLMGGSISANAACSIAFCDNAANGTVLYRTPALLANTPYNFVVAGGQGVLGGSVNDAIIGVASANATVTGTLWGTAE